MPTAKRVSQSEERFRLILRARVDPRRHEILQKIGEAKTALSCYQVLGELCISAPTLSHHMKELEMAGLVDAVREASASAIACGATCCGRISSGWPSSRQKNPPPQKNRTL